MPRFGFLLIGLMTCTVVAIENNYKARGPLLVVGSINVDTTVHLDELPRRSETKIAQRPSPTLAVGGKGENPKSAGHRTSWGMRFGGQGP